jgi:hypothetical protein
MAEGVIASLIAAAVGALASFLVRNRHILKAVPRCLFWQRQRRVRISIAVLLRVVVDGRFLLARMPRRPDALGPLGGAVRFDSVALRELTEIGFDPQLASPPGAAGAQDLRGFLLARELPQFVRWFWSGRNREDSLACLRRELREECAELALPVSAADIDGLQFSFMWRVVEGPRLPSPNSDYLQFRLLDVFDLSDVSANRGFKEVLLNSAGGSPVTAVSVAEIKKGRMEADPRCSIGSHA